MADTTYSPQYILNTLYGSAPTQFSEQGVANKQMGNAPTAKSWQQILNENKGNAPTAQSVQQLLFTNLSAALGLSGSYTQVSEQALLNRAYSAGITLNTILGNGGGGGGTSGSPVGLLLALTYA